MPPTIAGTAQGPNGFQSVEVTLSSVQILALLGTPVTIVAAPGIGLMIVPILLVMRLLAGAAAYTDAGGAVQLKVGTQVFAFPSNAIFLTTTSPNRALQSLSLVGAAGTGGNPPTDDNAALQITKITNNFAAGNGTMHITCYFTIEPTT